MHNALLISEVLGCIVDHLVEDTARHSVGRPGDTDETGRQALAVLARTCRAFSEPALDGVWRRLHSLKPFLLCFRPTKAPESLDDDIDIAVDAPGPLLPFNEEEWNIVLRYASRVQELTLEYDELSIKILQSLWFRTTVLLPNLRSLHWIYVDRTSVAPIRLLLNPSLVHLDVRVDDGAHTSFLAFLESYHTLCPNLKSLELHHSPRVPEVTAAVSRAVPRFPNLENLGCDNIDEGALIHVIRSRCLQQFSSSLLNYQPDNLSKLAAYGTPEHPPFENLRILELHIEDLSSPFEAVSFYFRTVATPEVFHEFFTALSSATRRKSLRRIKLNTRLTVTAHGAPSQPVNFPVLSPLMTLNIRQFCISIRNPVSLSDDEIVQLVQPWPKLEILDLNENRGWNCPTSVQIPTLKGLVLLLARCPELHGLGFSLDATNTPSLSEAESLIRNTAVTRLSIANSPIQEPVTSVAHFLHKHLPSLTTVRVCLPVTARRMDYHRMWKRVDNEIRQITGRPSSPQLTCCFS
ncbi:hypothetical protein JVT61DRAFT_162 [Boletus reticuloceps]|uniref:Uncharacterized protein n=1 Tax=Boletus reticuloceps TaxID=495285 RepID=A0A8I2Z0L7_9AGAM|nr:hypothetical protein JVT61DRAFT_162 [Boletus reticuloceps]